MSAAKKRKIDDEGRVFNSEWCTKYLLPHITKVLSASSVKLQLQS